MVSGVTSANKRIIAVLSPARKAVLRTSGFSSPTRLTATSRLTPQQVISTIQAGPVSPIILPEQIPIAKELVDGHPLAKYITQRDPISSSREFDEILGKVDGTIHITAYENGGIPASPNEASEYKNGSWRRDNAIMIMGMVLAATLEPEGSDARIELTRRINEELIEMAKYDNQPFHRGHFTSFFFLNPDANENRRLAREKFQKDIHGLPRARHSINSSGALDEYYEWGHHQLDGLGAYLYAFFFAANTGIINLKEIDKALTEQNSENGIDSLFSVALHFLHEIEYWDQIDVGTWESRPAVKRASSVGVCLAAFKEAKKYFEGRGWETEKIIKVNPSVDLKRILEEGIKSGEATLNERIPLDGSPAKETNEIHSDSALALLLLFNPGLNEQQERAILKRVYEQMGEYGIRRMGDLQDGFMGENYALNPHGQGKWSAIYPDHKAAQWTLFDPILATYYYRKYIESGGVDEESFLLADKHLKRTLSQITKQDYSIDIFVNPHEKITVQIPVGVLPEARWRKKDEHGEVWLPNTNSPLQMVHAIFAIMASEATKAIKLREQMANHLVAA